MNTKKIKIIGLGNEGHHTISRLIKTGINDVEFIIVNTSPKEIGSSKTDGEIEPELTSVRVLNSKSIDTIKEVLQDSELVFVITDGQTEIESIPTIGIFLRNLGILTLGIIMKGIETSPIQNEQCAQVFREALDALIVLPSKNSKANVKSDEILSSGIHALTRLVMQQSILEVNLADMKSILQNAGDILLGVGKTSGEGRAQNAARLAISPTHIADKLKSIQRMLIIITGSSQLTLFEINDAVELIMEHLHDNANIIFGYIIDESLNNSVEITFFATDFNSVATHH